MNSERQIIRSWRRGIGIPVTAFAMAAALFSGCSQDEGPELDGDDLVAVNFTATMDGVALPTAKSAGTRSGVRNFTGTTDAGVPYRDYIDADGFQTRAFYPGTTGSKAGCANAPATRTENGGDEWTTTDEVGIFMLTEGGNLTTSANVLANNVQYKATPDDSQASEALFTPADAGIYYPQSGSNVNFIAYYPYDRTGDNVEQVADTYVYKVSVAGQSDPAAIDVLYAEKSGVAKSKDPVELEFGHVLSKITLNVSAGDGFTAKDIQDLLASNVTFNDMPVTAELALQDGKLTAAEATGIFNPLKAATAAGDAHATFTAILIPQEANAYKGRTVVFTVGGTSYTWKIDDTDNFEAANHYIYPVTVKKNGITVGNPTITGWREDNLNNDVTGNANVEVPPVGTVSVLIPAGSFDMGQDGVATLVHKVTLTQDFYMSKYEITNAQYAAFLNAEDIKINGGGIGKVTYYEDNFTTTVTKTQRFISTYLWGVTYDGGTSSWKAQVKYENHPVINVTWYGAKAYADWVGGSLPTEAQWEYACRAGTDTEYHFGNDEKELDDYDWYKGNSGNTTHPVGQKRPNQYGLYDMHGNAFEWCSDWYELSYEAGPASDPTGPASSPNIGPYRVLRGGGWISSAQFCRSACRSHAYPDNADYYCGFRVVFVP